MHRRPMIAALASVCAVGPATQAADISFIIGSQDAVNGAQIAGAGVDWSTNTYYFASSIPSSQSSATGLYRVTDLGTASQARTYMIDAAQMQYFMIDGRKTTVSGGQ